MLCGVQDSDVYASLRIGACTRLGNWWRGGWLVVGKCMREGGIVEGGKEHERGWRGQGIAKGSVMP